MGECRQCRRGRTQAYSHNSKLAVHSEKLFRYGNKITSRLQRNLLNNLAEQPCRLACIELFCAVILNSIEQICSRANKALFASVGHNRITFCPTFYLRRKSRYTPCDLVCATEFSHGETTVWGERVLLACYIRIARVNERVLPCRPAFATVK